jgi:hypothetical protein
MIVETFKRNNLAMENEVSGTLLSSHCSAKKKNWQETQSQLVNFCL